jgi:hypothetical protein
MSIGTKATTPIVGSSASIRTNASQALTMIVSSSGAATGRCPARKRRVKKSFHDVNPQGSVVGVVLELRDPDRLLRLGAHPAGR